MRKLLYILVAIACFQASAIAHADPFTQNFYLISNSGGSGGSGNFTLNVAPPTTPGQIIYQYTPGYSVLSLNVSPNIPAMNFTAASSFVDLIFYNAGVLTGFQYNVPNPGNTRFSSYMFSLGLNDTYIGQSCQYSNQGVATCLNDAGIVSLTPAAVTATPEPSSLLLLGTSLIAGCWVLRRRYSSTVTQAALLADRE